MILVSDEKIALSLMQKADISELLVRWLNDKDVVRYSRQRLLKHTLETSLAYFDSFATSGHLYVKIVERSENRMIGTMTAYFNEDKTSADLGILIGDKTVWGKGYGSRAWALLMGYLLTDETIKAVTGGCDGENKGMIALFRKVGMSRLDEQLGQDSLSNDTIFRYIKRKGEVA